jgi:hypothetical protein
MTLSSAAPANNHPYESLTPDVVLDALATLGLYGDGRLTGLNSYENRVYQVYLEDRSAVVVKFYRPGRWSDAEILEEHGFALELAAGEVPAVPPLAFDGKTLHHHAGFAFSVSPYRGGRAPELDNFEVLEWVGRFLARIHTVGSAKPFAARPALDLQTFGLDSRDWLLENDKIPLDMQRDWEKTCNEALDMVRATALALQPRPPTSSRASCACTATCTPATSCGRPPIAPAAAPTSSTWTTRAPASPYRTCGCCCRATARSAPRSCRACSTATSSFASSTGASWR